jgi:hypothetical protein
MATAWHQDNGRRPNLGGGACLQLPALRVLSRGFANRDSTQLGFLEHRKRGEKHQHQHHAALPWRAGGDMPLYSSESQRNQIE